jgi:hypothetical protein
MADKKDSKSHFRLFSIEYKIFSTDFFPKPGLVMHSILYLSRVYISTRLLIQPHFINFSNVAKDNPLISNPFLLQK